jgi:AraC-like DNA-binding protein
MSCLSAMAAAADVGFKFEAGFRTQFERRFGLTASMHK